MATLKFGLVIPLGDARRAAELARKAEHAGWDGFFVGEAIWSIDAWVTLAAAAVATERIRLGTMISPLPRMRPWKLASEAATLDHLSEGRAIVGLGAGAVWMGYQAFPDEVTDAATRAELLDEGIDILSILLASRQVDYNGKHHHLRLTAMDTMHYPPPSLQQPRVPLWVVGVWPRQRSMRRVLKCDGLIPHVIKPDGQFGEVRPEDLREMKAYVDRHRTLATPFDFIVEGNTVGLDDARIEEKLHPWAEAGATWWMETLFGVTDEQLVDRIRQGPPPLS
jgi:alkanesulfonate monooxygenase SsuD/methylene tetrahydromethanopterin reductase-like flavin-dependent oxidoreductase (luciferase family)